MAEKIKHFVFNNIFLKSNGFLEKKKRKKTRFKRTQGVI